MNAIQSPYLRADEAAVYLRFPSTRAFLKWARRQGLASGKTGRINLYRRDELEAHVERLMVPARPRLVQRKAVAK